MKKINTINRLRFNFKQDVVLRGIRISSGRPSKYHIVNELSSPINTFCGFESYISEESFHKAEENDFFFDDFCKKCLKSYNK